MVEASRPPWMIAIPPTWAAALLVLAWLPALAYMGHWSVPPAGGGAFVAPTATQDHSTLAHPPEIPWHWHTAVAGENPVGDADPHGAAQHAEHGHGGTAASAAIVALVPAPLTVEAVAAVAHERPAVSDPPTIGDPGAPLTPPPR